MPEAIDENIPDSNTVKPNTESTIPNRSSDPKKKVEPEIPEMTRKIRDVLYLLIRMQQFARVNGASLSPDMLVRVIAGSELTSEEMHQVLEYAKRINLVPKSLGQQTPAPEDTTTPKSVVGQAAGRNRTKRPAVAPAPDKTAPIKEPFTYRHSLRGINDLPDSEINRWGLAITALRGMGMSLTEIAAKLRLPTETTIRKLLLRYATVNPSSEPQPEAISIENTVKKLFNQLIRNYHHNDLSALLPMQVKHLAGIISAKLNWNNYTDTPQGNIRRRRARQSIVLAILKNSFPDLQIKNNHVSEKIPSPRPKNDTKTTADGTTPTRITLDHLIASLKVRHPEWTNEQLAAELTKIAQRDGLTSE